MNLIEARFDLALRARLRLDGKPGLVAKDLGRARNIVVASPAFLDRHGRPRRPSDLCGLDGVSRIADLHDGHVRWDLTDTAIHREQVHLVPRLVSGDLRMQVETAVHGVGIALLPEPIVAAAISARLVEHVLRDWSAPEHVIHLVYPSPRGMLPSVRSLIDYLTIHAPASLV